MGNRSLTFQVAQSARELIDRLSAELGQSLTNVGLLALGYYRERIDADTAGRPEAGRVLGFSSAKQVSITGTGHTEIKSWLLEKAAEWRVTRGQILSEALDYFAAAIEAGHIGRPVPPAKPEPTPVPKQPSGLVNPIGQPVLKDRALCGVCQKQVPVHADAELLANHIAHPSVRPRGKFKLCDGSGKEPAGRVIHDASMDYQR
jgi:hypothetical protein